MSQYAPCHVLLNVRIKAKKKKQQTNHNITPRIVSLGRLCQHQISQGNLEHSSSIISYSAFVKKKILIKYALLAPIGGTNEWLWIIDNKQLLLLT